MDLSTPAAQQTSSPMIYATFWHRFVAFVVDAFLHSIITFVIGFPIGVILFLIIYEKVYDKNLIYLWEQGIGVVLRILVGWFYFALQEPSRFEATLGKTSMKLRVVGLSGERISFGRATGRYFGKMLSQLTLLIGYLIQPFTEKKQALHDMLAETLVVRD